MGLVTEAFFLSLEQLIRPSKLDSRCIASEGFFGSKGEKRLGWPIWKLGSKCGLKGVGFAFEFEMGISRLAR